MRNNLLYGLVYDSWRYRRANFLGLALAVLTALWLLGTGISSQITKFSTVSEFMPVAAGPGLLPHQLSYLVNADGIFSNAETTLEMPLAATDSLALTTPASNALAPNNKTLRSTQTLQVWPSDTAPARLASAGTPVEDAAKQTAPPEPARVYVIQPKIAPALPRNSFSYGPASALPVEVVSKPALSAASLASGELRARRATAATLQVSAMNH